MKKIIIAISVALSTFILTYIILIFLFPLLIIAGEGYNANKLKKISEQRKIAYNELYILLDDEINKVINNLYINQYNDGNDNEIEEYIIYNGDILLLDKINEYSLLHLTKEELRILRNTIFAQYGYIFQSKDLSEHFNRFVWYTPQYNNVDEKLTEYDKHIIEIISKIENEQINANIQGILEIFYTKAIRIDKIYYQLMTESNAKFSFPLQNKKPCELNEIFPAYINAIKNNGNFYNEFALKLFMEQYENITRKIIEAKTNDLIEYINYYSYYPEVDMLVISDFTGYKDYYEIINENIFDYFLNQCIISNEIVNEINFFIVNLSDYSFLNIPVILIDGVYYASIAINELQKSMEIVSPYLVKNTKNILKEGINYQTEIYTENIDSYVDWFYSYFTNISKTLKNIIGFITGEKSVEEKYYTDNFNRIMNNNTNFDLIIGEEINRQINIIKNIYYEYLDFKRYFSVNISQNTINSIGINDFIEPFIDDIVSYYDQVFEALDNANNYYFQEYTISDNKMVNTAKTSAKLLSSVNFFGGILIDYLSLKTQELLNRAELGEQIFNSMIENQRNKISIIDNPFNYLFDKLDIGNVLYVDNYFAGFNTYQHYGVYIGNGKVIHFAPLEGQEISMENGVIHETTVERFLNGRALKIDTNIEKNFSDNEIVQRARSRLGEKGYDLLTNNCEHLARWCVTGENISYQVINSPQKIENAISTIRENYVMFSKFIELFN